ASAPKPIPAKNHTKLLLSRSDIQCLRYYAYHGWYILRQANTITGESVDCAGRYGTPSAALLHCGAPRRVLPTKRTGLLLRCGSCCRRLRGSRLRLNRLRFHALQDGGRPATLC